jgi:hypothetical protein
LQRFFPDAAGLIGAVIVLGMIVIIGMGDPVFPEKMHLTMQIRPNPLLSLRRKRSVRPLIGAAPNLGGRGNELRYSPFRYIIISLPNIIELLTQGGDSDSGGWAILKIFNGTFFIDSFLK